MKSRSTRSGRGGTFVRTLAVVSLGVAAGLGLLPAGAAQADGSGGSHVQYRWDQPVVTVASTVSSAWGVAAAVREWNAHRVEGQPRLVLRNSAPNPDVTIGPVSRPGQWWTGLTSGTSDGDIISSIRIDLNTASIRQSRFRYDGNLDAAKHWTTSHELGHALGLEHHQSVTRSVMSYDNPWWKTEGRPSGYDFRQLDQLY
jgi:predicted Zn-dependent protease